MELLAVTYMIITSAAGSETIQQNVDGLPNYVKPSLSRDGTLYQTTMKPERKTFTCLCNTCPEGDLCVSDYFCTAISHREGREYYTSYGCLNHSQAFMELAYCEGGKVGKSFKNSIRTVCCIGEKCNDVPPPDLPTTTTMLYSTAVHEPCKQSGARYSYRLTITASQTRVTIANPVPYLAIPCVLAIILVSLVAILISKKMSTSRQRWKEKSKLKNYIGDNLSAQPLTEDSSIELPDPTSGSGSGMPMLVQRTVAKSVTLVEQIGTGKYGNVHKGIYHGSFVAVKIFLSKDIDSWARENEIYTTLLLRHDNILGFIASDMISCDSVTQFWLICHYHENGSLYDYLNQPCNAITLSQCLSMLHSAASGLVHLHSEIFGTQAKPAIAHRDVKSKNILVKDDGSCCIADLGLAVTHKSKDNSLNIGNNNKVGTKRYMAPEMLEDTANYNDFESYKRADIYAFSLVMWETAQCTTKNGFAEKYFMPYGGLVQNDPTFEEMRHAVVEQKKRPPISKDWNCHPIFEALSKLIQECWSEDPTARLTVLRIKKTLSSLLNEASDCK